MLDTDVKKVFCSRNGEGWKKRFSCSLSLFFFSLEKSGFLQEVHRNLMAVAAQWFAALCLQKLKHIYKNMCQASPTDLQTRHAERGVNHVQEIKIFRATKYGGPITLTYSKCRSFGYVAHLRCEFIKEIRKFMCHNFEIIKLYKTFDYFSSIPHNL